MLTFLRNNARWIAGGFLLTFFSSFGQTFFIGLSGEELRAKFDLTDGEFGLTYMVATLASAITPSEEAALPILVRVQRGARPRIASAKLHASSWRGELNRGRASLA